MGTPSPRTSLQHPIPPNETKAASVGGLFIRLRTPAFTKAVALLQSTGPSSTDIAASKNNAFLGGDNAIRALT